MNLLERLEQTSPYIALRNGINRGLVSFLQKHLAMLEREDLSVVELACGSAHGSRLLAQLPEVSSSVGIDISTELLSRDSTEANFVVADIFKPPFREQSFDLVWNSSSVEHFEDTAQVIARMSSLVRPGGFLYIGVPYLVGPLAFYYLTPLESWREWLGRPFSKKKLLSSIDEAGLEPVGEYTYFFRFFYGVIAQKPALK